MRPRVAVGSLWTERRVRVAAGSGAGGAWSVRRTPILAESFTGIADGAPWPASRWTAGRVPAGGSVVVQSGAGAMNTGSAGGYSSADSVAVTAAGQVADIEVTYTFVIPDDDNTGADLVIRSNDAAGLSGGYCVMAQVRRSKVAIYGVANWSYTEHASKEWWLSPATPYRVRVQATQGMVRVRLWLAGQPEPSTWDVETHSVARLSSGYWGFFVPGPGAAGTKTVTVDDVTAYVPLVRDKYRHPFAPASIWNTPIGTGAVYVPMDFVDPEVYGVSNTYIVFDPDAPLRALIDRGYYWPYTDGTAVVGTDTGVQVHWPDDYLIPAPAVGVQPDRPSAAIQADGHSREFQYTVRPAVGSNISMFESPRAVHDLAGDGYTMLAGSSGGHGGSGLTGVGGTLRVGEITGSNPIRHVLSATFNLSRYGTKQGGNVTDGYRWPARWADSAWSTEYGRVDSGAHARDGLGMGALLALPTSVDLPGLGFETTEGAKLAQAFRDYGCYVTDNTGELPDWNAWQLNTQVGVSDEYPAIDSYNTGGINTPFGRDMTKIYTRLAVVDNNTAGQVGGPGTRLVPYLI